MVTTGGPWAARAARWVDDAADPRGPLLAAVLDGLGIIVEATPGWDGAFGDRTVCADVYAGARADDLPGLAALTRGERSRAVAARFERTDQRWICTALDFS